MLGARAPCDSIIGMADLSTIPLAMRRVRPAPVGRFSNRDFGAIEPSQMKAILTQAERGVMLENWADLCEWIAEDDRVGSVLDTRIDSVCALPFQCMPGKGDPALAQRAADACQSMLESTDKLTQICEDLLNAYPVGYSAAEHVWSRDAGWWVSQPATVTPRDIAFTDSWGFKFRTYQTALGTGYGNDWLEADAHRNKFITFAMRKRGSTPLRAGAMRQLAWLWLFKRWAYKFWLNAAEKSGTPPTIGRVQRDATQQARDTLQTGLENLSSGQIVMLEENTNIEWPDTKMATSADVWERLIDKLDKAITLAVLGSMDAVDGGANGSLARAEVQNATTVEPRISKLAAQLYEVIERDWLAPFLYFNADKFGGVVPPTPQLVVKTDESKTIQPIYQYHLTGKIISKDEVRAQLGLPPLPAGGDELLDVGAVPPPGEQTAFDFGAEAPAALPLARRGGATRATRTTPQPTSATSSDLATLTARALGL